jgi:hypothetical protein
VNFLKKLFGFGSAETDNSRTSRSPRIRLLLADGARFETSEGAFPLLNISESGLGLLAEDGLNPGQYGGMLYLGGESLDVKIEVVRRTGTFAGARFLSNSDVVRATLRRLFLEEIRATEMNEVASGALREGVQGIPRWYYAPGNYELFFVEVDGRPQHLEMEWNGRIVSVGKDETARTGTIFPEDRDKPSHAKANLVHWTGSLEDDDRAKAIRILENVPGLDPRTRGMLVAMLR